MVTPTRWSERDDDSPPARPSPTNDNDRRHRAVGWLAARHLTRREEPSRAAERGGEGTAPNGRWAARQIALPNERRPADQRWISTLPFKRVMNDLRVSTARSTIQVSAQTKSDWYRVIVPSSES